MYIFKKSNQYKLRKITFEIKILQKCSLMLVVDNFYPIVEINLKPMKSFQQNLVNHYEDEQYSCLTMECKDHISF